MAWVLLACVVVPAAVAGTLWVRMGTAPLILPAALTARIEARLDDGMAANVLTLGGVAVGRSSTGGRIDLHLRDVRLADPDGAERAAFPLITVGLSSRALAMGRVQPVQIDLAGAGLQLTRGTDGRLDLAFVVGPRARPIGLVETLERVDTMFSSQVLADLDGVGASGLDLAIADAITGRVLRVRDARMRLERAGDALTLTLGGALEGTRAATIDLAMTRAGGSGDTNIGFAFANLAARDIATAGPGLAWVDRLRAPISGFVGAALHEDGTLGDLRATLAIGPGQIDPGGDRAPLRFDRLDSDLRFDAEARRLVVERLQLDAPDLAFAATGHADLGAAGQVGVQGADARTTLQVRLTDIRLTRADLFDAPLVLDGASIDARLTLLPDLLLEIGQMVVHDDGLAVQAGGRIVAGPGGLEVALDAHLPQADLAEVMSYWPEAAIPATRAWLGRSLGAGRVRGVDFAFRAAPGQAAATALTLDFDGLGLRVLPHFPPIEGGAGYVSMAGPEVIVRLDAGRMDAPGGGAVSLGGTALRIADARQPGPEAQIDLAVSGRMTDVLTVLTAPPVNLFAQGSMTPARIGTGALTATGRIITRIRPARQPGAQQPQPGPPPMAGTRLELAGVVTGFAADALVPGRSLAADRLDIAIDSDGEIGALRVSGGVLFDGVPAAGTFSRPLGAGAAREGRIVARAGLTRAHLASLGLRLPDWMLSGTVPAALEMALPDGEPPVLRLTSDLAGAGLALPPLGWRLAEDAGGQLAIEARLGPAPEVTSLTLRAGGLDLAGRVALVPGGGFDRLTADRFRLGDWLDVRGTMIGQGARPPAIEIGGGTIDLRGAPQTGGGGAGGQGGPITARLDRLQIAEGIALTDLGAEMTATGGLSGQFRGRVNGEAPVTGTLIATPTGPAVRLRAEDGGAVLRSAGLFRTLHGGALELILQATGAVGTYDGTLSIDSPRLRDAPVMAEILNVISVVGLIEQLTGEGINLGQVNAAFRLSPEGLTLREATALGPALGLSMEGTYALPGRMLDMQGVISPLYVVNGLMGALFSPRGEGLFGFSYRLTGRSDTPQVAVNPLSILTPGPFREIFRRAPADLPGNR